ncbi:MAG: DUF3837 family protein [Lachnospiraceae bacterium]|nr:DUF3837 family protein [Lachnospiraceae bacterium]MCR4732632.1 DUF3837 domain-containing protein [Lachnospiraceae bacterium]
MVPLLTQQSVDHKIKFQMSVLVGNYEYYYACGIFSRLVEADWNEETAPMELMEKVQKALGSFRPEGKYQEYLAYLIRRYEPNPDDWDDNTRLLFAWGEKYQFPEEEQ